jgi:hypothetical protein
VREYPHGQVASRGQVLVSTRKTRRSRLDGSEQVGEDLGDGKRVSETTALNFAVENEKEMSISTCARARPHLAQQTSYKKKFSTFGTDGTSTL